MTDAFLDAIECHKTGDIDGARRRAYEIVERDPRHVDALHFLGMIEMSAGRMIESRHALEQAVAIDPGGPQLTSLARLLGNLDPPSLAEQIFQPPDGPAGDEYLHRRAVSRSVIGDLEGAAADLTRVADRRPQDLAAALAAARANADVLDTVESERLYRHVAALDPQNPDAILGLVGILQTLGRGDEIAPVFRGLEASADPRLIALGAAFGAQTAGRFRDALVALNAASGVLPEGAEAQLRGELADRAGDAATATEAFAQMNRADATATPQWREGIRRYREMLDDSLARLRRGIQVAPSETLAPPTFLLGFPRSGTTLLDTFLMGHHGVEVHEERPFLDAAAETPDDPIAARRAYRAALNRETRYVERVQVDKYPLATARAPLLHAMFPEARYIFALRDPRDVVLSCFMTRFRLNWGVSSFLDLKEAALTYDRVMTVWAESVERLQLNVHLVRYEELVDDPGEVLGRVMTFMGLPFDLTMLEHQSTARARGMIATPSNAQVVEPLYRRSAGRWLRYLDVVNPLMPVLGPWCDRFGYAP